MNKKWFGQIDITNHCHIGNCLYCSRYERHIPKDKKYFMSVEEVEKAVLSYEGFESPIGLIGGDPLLHPKFTEICEMLLKHNKKEKYGLWTSINPKTSKYKDIILNTFGFVAFNEHNSVQQESCKHQPLTLALVDMVKNEELRKELTEQCYFRLKWCGTVNPNGAFHCEIAGSIAYLLGYTGWPIEKGWYNKDWHEQYYLCELCGGCIPQERQLIGNKKQKISPLIYNLFKMNNISLGDHEIISEPYSMAYLKKHADERAGAYRGDIGEIESSTINIDWRKYHD